MSHSISESRGHSPHPSSKATPTLGRPGAKRSVHRSTLDRPLERRALLVAFHFGDGATGAFRWDSLVADLVSHGWSFDILTCAASETEARGRGGVADPGAERVRVFPVFRPAGLGNLLKAGMGAVRRVRGRLRAVEPTRAEAEGSAEVVDRTLGMDWGRPGASRRVEAMLHFSAQLAWARKATKEGLKLARQNDYQVIIVSSPPHAAQLVGAKLSRKLGIPYVADYRDPWTFGIPPTPYLRYPAHRKLENWLERSTIRRASLVICLTGRGKEAVDEAYSGEGVSTVSVPNGYDKLESIAKPDKDCFRIVYAGALYPYHDLRAMMAACGRLRLRSGLREEQFRVEFMGNFGRTSLEALAHKYDLASCFTVHPRGTRQQALDLQQSAAVLVSFDHWHGLSVVMKFYDCVQLYGSLLLLCSNDSALARAADSIGVPACDPADSMVIDRTLDAALARWRNYDFESPADQEGIFDRKHQSASMREILNAVASGAVP